MSGVAKIDRWTVVGLGSLVAITIVASFTTLAELARFAGWGDDLKWLFPASIDVLAVVACRIWLAATFAPHARNYAKWVTLVASGMSVVGNGVGHLAATGHIVAGLLLVVLVGSVPPASLAAVVHLAVLASAPVPGRKARHKVAEQTKAKDESGETAETISKPKAEKPKPKAKQPTAGRDLLAEARAANEAHKAEHGTDISRNKLRVRLGVGQGTASDLIEQLREEVA